LEKEIDILEEALPPLKNFINPGGSYQAANFHVARSLTRKVERRYFTYSNTNDSSKIYLKFFNRLSDFLFVASRYVNFLNKVKENIAK